MALLAMTANTAQSVINAPAAPVLLALEIAVTVYPAPVIHAMSQQTAVLILLLQVIALFQAVVMPTALTIRLMLASHARLQPAKLFGPIKPMALPAAPQLMALGRVALVFQMFAIKLA